MRSSTKLAWLRLMVVLATALLARSAGAAPGGPAETSLDKCQNTVRVEAVKYVQKTHKAIATCLGQISTRVVKENGGIGPAVAVCTAQFNNLGRNDGKSFGDVFASRVTAACSPTPGKHTLADVLGVGMPTVAETLRVSTNLNQLCTHFGDGTATNTVAKWTACMRGAQDCSILNAISAEFPRALEWLAELAAAMPPSLARDAVLATEAAIDGASDDGIPHLQCASTCGDGAKAANEQCDGADLGGATCQAIGYDFGTLACGSTCAYDVSGCANYDPAPCPGCELLATGQASCWNGRDDPFGGPDPGPPVTPCPGTDQDGETQHGASLAYLDNGDGTITDLNTGLMWEKKSDDGSLHDKDHTYDWSGVCDLTLTLCSRDSDCPPGVACIAVDGQTPRPNGITAFEWIDQLNAGSFAGYSDWRLPNRRELESLLNLERSTPAISPVFNNNCGIESQGNPGCTVTTCSCTDPNNTTWTSSTGRADPPSAWTVWFLSGQVTDDVKISVAYGGQHYVRAVRGGA